MEFEIADGAQLGEDAEHEHFTDQIAPLVYFRRDAAAALELHDRAVAIPEQATGS